MALLDASRPQSREPRWPKATDAELVRGVQRDAEGAFDEIFTRYHAPLVRYCRGILLDDDVAQDAAQNALAAALRAIGSGTSTPLMLGPWLYRIAQREAVDLQRRRRRDAALQAGATNDMVLNLPAPSDERVRDRLRELVGDLARLPLRQRSALLLRELSGLGYSEIAVALETTPAAARQSVSEARHALTDADAGRRESCSAVHALVDSGDGRRLRGRRARAHLEDCAACQAFAGRIADRRHDLALLFPLGPAVLASGGGGGAIAASGWSLGLGASGAAKCAVVCATAALIGVGSMSGDVTQRTPRKTPVKVIARALQPASGSIAMASTPAARHPLAGGTRPQESRVRAVTLTRTHATGPRRLATVERHASGLPEPAAPGATKPAASTMIPVPAVVTGPQPGTPVVAPTPAATTGTTPSGRQLIAQELQRQIQEAIAQDATVATTSTSPSTFSLQSMIAAQAAAQPTTTATLSAMQTQLELLRRMLQPSA